MPNDNYACPQQNEIVYWIPIDQSPDQVQKYLVGATAKFDQHGIPTSNGVHRFRFSFHFIPITQHKSWYTISLMYSQMWNICYKMKDIMIDSAMTYKRCWVMWIYFLKEWVKLIKKAQENWKKSFAVKA